jgi:hypothetical protein
MSIILFFIVLPIFMLAIVAGYYLVAALIGAGIVAMLFYKFFLLQHNKENFFQETPPEEKIHEKEEMHEIKSEEENKSAFFQYILNDLEKFKDIPEMNAQTIKYLQLYYFEQLQNTKEEEISLENTKNEDEQEDQKYNTSMFQTDKGTLPSLMQQMFGRPSILLFIALFFFGGILWYISHITALTLSFWLFALLPFIWDKDIVHVSFVRHVLSFYFAAISSIVFAYSLVQITQISSLSSIIVFHILLHMVILSILSFVFLRGEYLVTLKKISAPIFPISFFHLLLLGLLTATPFEAPYIASIILVGIIFTSDMLKKHADFFGSYLTEYMEKSMGLYTLALPCFSIWYMIFWKDYSFFPVLLSTLLVIFVGFFAFYIFHKNESLQTSAS